jgi:hypothetical protein
LLVKTAIDLFNAILQQQITTVDFRSTGSAESDDSSDAASGADSGGSGVGSSGSDTSGAAGATGDGAELSPFVNAACEFVLDHKDGTALADLLLDGSVDRVDLQALVANVKGDTGLQKASARFFPHGIQLLGSNGQPLRTTTDAQGAYFLPMQAATAGFVRCAPRPLLAVSAFVPPRQPGELLTGQNVLPSSQIFTTFIFPSFPHRPPRLSSATS